MDKNQAQESTNGEILSKYETKSHLAAIIDHAPGLVYSIDRSFRLITLNKHLKETVREIFGLTLQPGDSALQLMEDIIPSMVQEWKGIYAKAFAGEPQNFIKEFDLHQKTFWQFSLNPIHDGEEVTSLACFVNNVTEQKLNDIQLLINEAQYRLVAENPILGLIWGKADGIIYHANQTFCELLGYALDEVKNMHFSEFTHPEDLAIELPLFNQLVNGEIRNYRMEKRYITKNKRAKWVEVNITAVKDKDGIWRHGIGIVQDISSKKQAEESLLKSEANMRHILDNAVIASGLLDINFNILTANRIANEWAVGEIGITLNEGENFLDHFPEAYKSLAVEVLHKVLKGTPHRYEAKYIKKDKSVSWYHVRIQPIADDKGTVIGVCITAEDTTQRKNAEEEILALNNSLEKKVKERTRELEEANSELEAFTYSVSHDLLSPLRNIDSFIDILLEDYRNVLNEDGNHTLSVIKRNSTLMARLINDLLGFARIGKLPLVKEMVTMDGVVVEVMDELRFMTNKLAARIKVKDLHPAYCDSKLIKQVWINLISNAVKYSATKANPEIEIGSMEQEGEIIYYIKDNGVGFDIKYVDKLFGVFHRLHKAGEFEGTGVGLAIVHRIVTKHGGRIWAEGKVNEGAAFYFTL